MKNLKERFLVRCSNGVVVVARTCASASVNSACTTWFYEPKQPNGLEKLKKDKYYL